MEFDTKKRENRQEAGFFLYEVISVGGETGFEGTWF